MIAGMVMQAARGYYRFEIPLYLESLLGVRFIEYLLIAVLAMTIHVLVNHKYSAICSSFSFYIGNWVARRPRARARPVPVRVGLRHQLLGHESAGGRYVWPFVWWKLYWSAFARAAAHRG